MEIKVTVKKGKKRPSPTVEVYEKEWTEKESESQYEILAKALLGVKEEEKDGEKI